MNNDVCAKLEKQGFEGPRIHVKRMLNMRSESTNIVLIILPNDQDGDRTEDFEVAFKRVHKQEFEFLSDTKSIVVDGIKVMKFRTWIMAHRYDQCLFSHSKGLRHWQGH